MADEKSKLKQQSERIKALEKALVHSNLKLLKSESDMEAICELYGVEDIKKVKKKSGKDRSQKA